MKSDNKKIDFDLSVLSLEELIEVYENIDEFIKLLNSKKIIEEQKEKSA